MKSNRWTTLLLASLYAFDPAGADESAAPPAEMEPVPLTEPRAPAWNQWEVGPDLYWYRYEEPGFMELDGFMVGVSGRFSRYIPGPQSILDGKHGERRPGNPGDTLVLRIEGRLATGEADYEGGLQDGTPLAVSGIDSNAHEIRLLGGYRVQPRAEHYTTLFVGFGYRYKDDDSSFHPAGYKRESTYRYLPAVLTHTRRLASGNELAFTAEYDLFLSGEHMSDLTPFEGGRITNKQSSGHGLRASIAYAGAAARFDWIVEPYIRYWDIDDSDPVVLLGQDAIGLLWEPANTTTELGVQARFVF
jgi:hypothetical protein